MSHQEGLQPLNAALNKVRWDKLMTVVAYRRERAKRPNTVVTPRVSWWRDQFGASLSVTGDIDVSTGLVSRPADEAVVLSVCVYTTCLPFTQNSVWPYTPACRRLNTNTSVTVASSKCNKCALWRRSRRRVDGCGCRATRHARPSLTTAACTLASQ